MSSWILRLHQYDRRLFVATVGRRRPLLSPLMRLVTRAGDPHMIVAGAIALAAGIVPGTGGAGVTAAGALVVSHILSQLIKRTISRPRPRLPVGFSSLVTAPDRFSFPSGHASASLALALPIALAVGFPIALPLIAFALLVGVTRCYLGVHYPGDVVAGWGLAILSAALVTMV